MRKTWRWTTAAIVLGVVLSLPTLKSGFVLDDYCLISVLEKWQPREDSANLYASSLFRQMALPWWKGERLRVAFWRPLSSSLLELDYRAFGRRALPWHVHSLLWLAALLGVSAVFYSRLSPELRTASMLVFALDESHALTSGWIANRHAVVAVVFALLGLTAHLRWRETGWRPGAILSVVSFSLALLAGETAFGMLAYVMAYELFGSRGDWRRRAVGLTPVAALGGAYLVLYKIMGYGVVGSGFYLDPVARPGEFLQGFPARVATLFGGALVGFPSDLWMFPRLRVVQVGVGAVAVLGIGAVLVRWWRSLDERDRQSLRWLLPGALASMVPLAASLPSDRMLLVPMIGLGPGIAAILREAWKRRRGDGPRGRRVFAGALAVALFAIHFLLAPIGRLATQWNLVAIDEKLAEITTRLGPSQEFGPRGNVILVNAPDPFVMYYLGLMYNYRTEPGAITWNVLALDRLDHELVRRDARTVALRALGGSMLTSLFEGMVRAEEPPFAVGDGVSRDVFDAEILEVGEGGPTSVAFHFREDLDDRERTHFFEWTEHGLAMIDLPREGESLIVSDAPSAIPGF